MIRPGEFHIHQSASTVTLHLPTCLRPIAHIVTADTTASASVLGRRHGNADEN